MPFFMAVEVLSGSLKAVMLSGAGERWAQGCLCSACWSEERIRSPCWSGTLQMMDPVASYLPERPWPGVGTRDSLVFCKLDLKDILKQKK